MSMYDNIPADLTVTVTFFISANERGAEIEKQIPNVNVRELVAGIKNLSKEKTKYLRAKDLVNEFATTDERARYVFSRLVSGREYFMINSDVIACNLLTAQVNTAAQSVLCLLQSIIDAQTQTEAKAVTENINLLINKADQRPELVLPSVLSGFVSDSDVAAWLKSAN